MLPWRGSFLTFDARETLRVIYARVRTPRVTVEAITRPAYIVETIDDARLDG